VLKRGPLNTDGRVVCTEALVQSGEDGREARGGGSTAKASMALLHGFSLSFIR